MKKLGWIIVIAWWAYFLTAIFLYGHFWFKWGNTVDVLLSFALLIAFSAWYVIKKFRSGPGKVSLGVWQERTLRMGLRCERLTCSAEALSRIGCCRRSIAASTER